jgi:hypothetical protein
MYNVQSKFIIYIQLHITIKFYETYTNTANDQSNSTIFKKTFQTKIHSMIVSYHLECLHIFLIKDWLIVRIFRHTQQFFSYMMAVIYYWWKSEPRYITQCIWEETTDLPQVKWQTFSHSHIGPSRIRTDTCWRWEVSWYETDVLPTWLRPN